MQIFARVFLSLLYLCQDLREKYGNDSNTDDENELLCSRKEDRRYSENGCERIDNLSYLSLCESEFHQTKVKMGCLISLHRIFSCENTRCHDIDEIDHVESKYCEDSRDFPSTDNGESREEECENDRTRVSHDYLSFDIRASEEERNRNDDCEDRQEKSTIFLTCATRICEVELDGEDREDDE